MRQLDRKRARKRLPGDILPARILGELAGYLLCCLFLSSFGKEAPTPSTRKPGR
jgi:hypothetical protein